MLKMIVHSIPLLNIIKDLVMFVSSASLSFEQMEEFLDEGTTEVFIGSIHNEVIRKLILNSYRFAGRASLSNTYFSTIRSSLSG